jgi:hypothetical protein
VVVRDREEKRREEGEKRREERRGEVVKGRVR